MTNVEIREECISNLIQQIDWIEKTDAHKFPGWGHTVNAMRQAIALLKVHEPRMMTVDEVSNAKAGTVIWIESDYYCEFRAAIVNHKDNTKPDVVSVTVCDMREGIGSLMNYGKTWRCWTSEPTDEQRKVVKWE